MLVDASARMSTSGLDDILTRQQFVHQLGAFPVFGGVDVLNTVSWNGNTNQLRGQNTTDQLHPRRNFQFVFKLPL